jgi:hypothetical protein
MSVRQNARVTNDIVANAEWMGAAVVAAAQERHVFRFRWTVAAIAESATTRVDFVQYQY